MGPFNTEKYLTQTRQKGSWYADVAWFVFSSNPWFIRGTGYDHGSGAGVFAFSNSYGSVASHISFRVVLMP